MGSPLRQGRNRRGEEEFFYPKGIYRFDDFGLVEVTLDVEAITIAGETIGFNSLPVFLKTNDEQAEDVGDPHGKQAGDNLERSGKSGARIWAPRAAPLRPATRSGI